VNYAVYATIQQNVAPSMTLPVNAVSTGLSNLYLAEASCNVQGCGDFSVHAFLMGTSQNVVQFSKSEYAAAANGFLANPGGIPNGSGYIQIGGTLIYETP
jgi:hypothetical protein